MPIDLQSDFQKDSKRIVVPIVEEIKVGPEWDSVNNFAWKIIEALELDRPFDLQASDS